MERAADNPKATIPWGSLVGSEDVYVDKEYVPEGFTFKEPSKLSKSEARDRLKFWYDRQTDNGIKTVFEFCRVRGKGGEPMVVVQKSPTPRNKSQSKGKRRASSSDSDANEEKDEEDSTEDENEDDEDEDEDEDEEGEAEDDKEEEQPKATHKKGKLVRKNVKPLPFTAVRVTRPTGVPRAARNTPATGPQYDPPATRRRAEVKKKTNRSNKTDNPDKGKKTDTSDKTDSPNKRKRGREEEAGSPMKKQRKPEDVTKKGPPKGQRRDARKKN